MENDSSRFEIRAARAEDRDPIRQIYLSAVGPQRASNKAPWEQLIQAGGLLVAEAEGCIIGFGGIDVNATEQLKWLYLLPQHQGVSIGSQLLRQLESIGWEAGLNSIRLHSAPGAVEFYRRHGYRPVVSVHETGHDHEGVEMMKSKVM